MQSQPVVRKWRACSVFTALALLFAVAFAACGSSTSSTTKRHRAPAAAPVSTTWSLPGADLQNTRHVGGPINASNEVRAQSHAEISRRLRVGEGRTRQIEREALHRLRTIEDNWALAV